MKLKNYSTSVKPEKSIMQIELLLSDFKASAIMKEYQSDGKVRTIAFRLNEVPYKLPMNTEGVKNVIFKNKRYTGRVNGMKSRDDKAYRISCRIIKDWLHSQLSLIMSGQAQPDEILLPYIYNGQKTLYEAFKDKELGKFQLEAPKK